MRRLTLAEAGAELNAAASALGREIARVFEPKIHRAIERLNAQLQRLR